MNKATRGELKDYVVQKLRDLITEIRDDKNDFVDAVIIDVANSESFSLGEFDKNAKTYSIELTLLDTSEYRDLAGLEKKYI